MTRSIQTVIEKYKQLEKRFDYVLVEGSDFSSVGVFTELDVNLMFAKNLNIPALVVGSGNGKKTDEIVHSLQLSYKSFRKKEVDVIGIIANKINSTEVSFLAKELNSHIPKNIQIDIIPTIDLLKNPTVREVVQELDGKVLFGKQFLDNAIGSYNSGSMQLRNYLTRIHENALVVTPGDRADIILGALQANASSNYPKIAGIIFNRCYIARRFYFKTY